MPEMDEYRSYVAGEAEKADGQEIILNRTKDHASVLIAAIFNKATAIIEIITGELSDEAFGTDEVCLAAKQFLERNVAAQVEIVSERPVTVQTSALLRALRRDNLINRVHLFRASEVLASAYECHFIVADGLHYRFVEDLNTFEALAQFGNAKFGERLRRIFAGVKSRAVPVDP